jgi:thymidylate kinase
MHLFFIEGPDGSGKTTLATNLARITREQRGSSAHVIQCREPNSLIKGLRELVLNPFIRDVDFGDQPERFSRALPSVYTSTLLMIAGMAETLAWLTKLDQMCVGAGKSLIVFQDRSIVSTLIHQAMSSANKATMIDFIMRTYCDVVQGFPDYHRKMILLNAPNHVLADRFKKDSIFDTENWETNVADAYRKIAEQLTSPGLLPGVHHREASEELRKKFLRTITTGGSIPQFTTDGSMSPIELAQFTYREVIEPSINEYAQH